MGVGWRSGIGAERRCRVGVAVAPEAERAECHKTPLKTCRYTVLFT